MVIKVDLQCYRCYKKVGKVIGKYPGKPHFAYIDEIRDQVYDEKHNRVIIIVVSCCPERIKKKIDCKGGESVESIEIVSKKKEAQAAEELKKAGKNKEGQGDEPKEGETEEVPARKHVAESVSGYPTIGPSGMYYNLHQPYYQDDGALLYHDRVPADYSEGMNFCDRFSDENTESCMVM